MMKKLLEVMEIATKAELKEANKNFPLFSSNHEGVAIIEEEIYEANTELEGVYNAFNRLKIQNVFDGIDDPDAVTLATELMKSSQRLAAEAIQVAAMAQKFMDSIEHRKTEHVPEFTQEHADYLANFEIPSFVKETEDLKKSRDRLAEIVKAFEEAKF